MQSVAVTANGTPLATDGVTPYEFSRPVTFADIGSTIVFVATITDSAGQTTTATRSVSVPVPAGYVAATVDPTSWAFGTVFVGNDAAKTFTLTNTGENPVTLTGVDLTGAAAFSLVPAVGACTTTTVLAPDEVCTVTARFAPTDEGDKIGSITLGYTSPGGTSPIVIPLTGTGDIFDTTASTTVSAVVPSTLGLTVSSAAPSLGTLIPGVAQDYTASTTLGVTTTGGSSRLTVHDPSSVSTGSLVNGSFTLASPLQAKADGGAGPGSFGPVGSTASPLLLATYPAPISNDPVAVTFKQPISATEPLRTGTYSKTVLFTLSTLTP